MTEPDAPVAPPAEDIRTRAVRGTLWFGGSRVVTQALTWLITIEVVRLLTPADYGLFGYCTLVAGFVDLVAELGLGAAIVQRRDLDDTDLETVFWLSLGLGLGLYGLTWFGAPFIAAFFDQPLLVTLLRVSMLTFIISSLRVVSWNLLTKRVDFRRRSLAEMAATLAGSVTTLELAFAGEGVWALVIGLIVRHAVLAVACVALQPWWPRGRFSRDGVRKVLGFGVRTSGGRVAWFLYSNADYLIVGKLLGQQALGFYTLIYEFATLPADRITSVINQVAFPVYAEVQDRPAEFTRFFLTTVALISMVTVPLMLGLAAVADLAVPLLLKPKWLPIVEPLQVMCVIGMVLSISSLISPPVLAKGRPGLILRYTLICLAILPVGFVIGSRYGLIGVCLAWVGIYPFVAAYWFRLSRPIIGYRWAELVRALTPAAVCGAAMTLVLLVLRPATAALGVSAWRLALLVAAGGLTYGTLLLTIYRSRVLDIRDAMRARR